MKGPKKGRPAGHPNRCTKIKRDGTQCANYGLNLTEPKLCAYHQGFAQLKQRGMLIRKAAEKLPMSYRKYLGPTLTQAIEQAVGIDPDEQLALYEELALMREYAGQFVKVYSVAREKGSADAVLQSGAAMRDALEAVAALCDKAGKLQAKAKDRFSIHDLKHIVDKMMVVHAKTCKAYNIPDVFAEAFAKAIDSELIIPQTTSTGTSLKPGEVDASAVEYDSSVPSAPPEIP